MWQQPKIDDIQSVSMVQLIPLAVTGEWNFSGQAPQSNKFKVSNYESIDEKLNELWSIEAQLL